MITHRVWKTVTQAHLPTSCLLIRWKWVFRIKQNGVYRACLVANGFDQIPGVNFSENISPVVNDIAFHVVLA